MTESTHEAEPNGLPVRVRTQTGRRRLTTVTVERPRCPACGGVRLRKYRSQRDQGDGSTLSWVRCLDEDCGYRFRLVQE